MSGFFLINLLALMIGNKDLDDLPFDQINFIGNIQQEKVFDGLGSGHRVKIVKHYIPIKYRPQDIVGTCA